MVSYGDVNTTAVAGTADTEVTIATITIPSGLGGRIKKVRWGYGSVVDAKAAVGYMELISNLKKGPWQFPIGFGPGGAASTSAGHGGELDVDIECLANEVWTIKATFDEDAVDAHAGLEWVK